MTPRWILLTAVLALLAACSASRTADDDSRSAASAETTLGALSPA